MFEPLDGRSHWRRSIRASRREALHNLNHRAAPTPVTDGRSVFVFFSDFGLVPYDLEGNERWQVPLGPFNNLHGMAASPVFADGKVILVCDQDTNAFFLAVDSDNGKVALVRSGGIATSLSAKTGAVLKQARLTGALKDYYASPIGADDKVQHGKVVVLRAAGDWKILAINEFESDIHATPAISEGRMYIRTRDALYAIGSVDQALTAY